MGLPLLNLGPGFIDGHPTMFFMVNIDLIFQSDDFFFGGVVKDVVYGVFIVDHILLKLTELINDLIKLTVINALVVMFRGC